VAKETNKIVNFNLNQSQRINTKSHGHPQSYKKANPNCLKTGVSHTPTIGVSHTTPTGVTHSGFEATSVYILTN